MSCLGDLKDRVIHSSAMTLKLYTREALTIPREAGRIALSLGSTSIDPEHFLLALAEATHTRAAELLEDAGVTAPRIRKVLERRDAEALSEIGIRLDAVVSEIESKYGRAAWEETISGLPPDFTCHKETDQALRAADRLATSLRHWTRTPEHLLLALIRQQSRACALLNALNADVGRLEHRVLEVLTRPD